MAEVYIHLQNNRGKIDPKIFGHFTEHAFANIYGGVYDPDSTLSGQDGLRDDVLAKIKQTKPAIMRYPGGNFVSNYHWENGIGPKDNRPRVFEYAWQSEESNQFGTADFIEMCRRVNAEPYLCVNLGNGTVEEAMNWVEYCNSNGNTFYANLRRSHGYEQPFNVKYWGLGNEIYGEWQMGYKNAKDYAKIAFEAAKAMKWVDPSIKLIACGYEQDSDWNYTVMKRLFSIVDYVSAHHYSCGWGPFNQDDYMQTMYIPDYMQKLNDLTVAALCTATNDNDNKIKVAWDEWNFFGWMVDQEDNDAVYNMQNAVVTALVLNMFLKNNDTIGMANYSTFVNINGAIGVKPDGLVLRPQYYVFDLLANNIGKYRYHTDVYCDCFDVKPPRNPKMERSIPGIDLFNTTPQKEKTYLLPYLDAVATGNDEWFYLSLVNKHPTDDIPIDCFVQDRDVNVTECAAYSIYAEDIKAANTKKHPNTVVTKSAAVEYRNKAIRFVAKAHSVNLIKFKVMI